MVEYEKLSERQRLYKESIRYVNVIIGIGGILFFLSLIPIVPTILQQLLYKVSELSYLD